MFKLVCPPLHQNTRLLSYVQHSIHRRRPQQTAVSVQRSINHTRGPVCAVANNGGRGRGGGRPSSLWHGMTEGSPSPNHLPSLLICPSSRDDTARKHTCIYVTCTRQHNLRQTTQEAHHFYDRLLADISSVSTCRHTHVCRQKNALDERTHFLCSAPFSQLEHVHTRSAAQSGVARKKSFPPSAASVGGSNGDSSSRKTRLTPEKSPFSASSMASCKV